MQLHEFRSSGESTSRSTWCRTSLDRLESMLLWCFRSRWEAMQFANVTSMRSVSIAWTPALTTSRIYRRAWIRMLSCKSSTTGGSLSPGGSSSACSSRKSKNRPSWSYQCKPPRPRAEREKPINQEARNILKLRIPWTAATAVALSARNEYPQLVCPRPSNVVPVHLEAQAVKRKCRTMRKGWSKIIRPLSAKIHLSNILTITRHSSMTQYWTSQSITTCKSKIPSLQIINSHMRRNH